MELHLFRAGSLEIALRKTAQGVSLSGIFDKKISRGMLSQSGPLLTLTAERLSDGETVKVVSDDGFADASIVINGNHGVITLGGNEKLPGVTVTVLMQAQPEISRVTFRTVLHSENTEYTLTECDHPMLWFDVKDSVKFLSPYGCGEAMDSDSEMFGHGYRSAQDYPSYGASFQYMAAWDEAKNRCLYYGLHDPVPASKKFHFVREVNAPTMYIKASQPLTEIDKGCNGQTLFGECVWQLTDGDWYDATLLYRDWVEKNALWMPAMENGKRTDLGWLEDVDVWLLVHIDGEDFADEIIETAKDMGDVKVAVHLYLWHNAPFDNDYPHYFPEKPTVRRELKKVQEAGIYVVPYINGRLWDTHDKGTEDWQYTAVAYPKACKDRNGKAITESYSSKEANGEHVVLSVMCPSTALWQEKVKSIVDKLVNDIGFDGVYIDQIAAAKAQLCCDRTHEHLPGGGTWWCESYYNLIDHVSRVQDPAILATECTAEMFMKHIQGYLSWLWTKNQQVPAFPVLYSDKVVSFGLTYNSFRGEGVRDGLAIFIAQGLLFGEQLGWMAPKFYREMPEQAFFKKCVLLRKQFREFFFGNMLRPPKLSDDAPRLRYENCPHANFSTVDYPAVQGALWQAKDGRKLLMLTNSQTMEAHATMQVELPDGEYALQGDASGVLTIAEGKAELAIPATGVVWIEA
ncbi:MAG: hypothetical protein IKT91_00995 [Clostridia bacterium]|nr:hypothetical protein [Clostridia bacterium]